MRRVRFAPSPTGSLHIGNALSAVANRRFGDWLLLRIDDTDAARNIPGGEEAILADLAWLGIEWDEGPVRQSGRQERYREAAAGLPERFEGITLLRPDASAALPDEELAARAGAPPELAPALRGARDLNEAREAARAILEPAPARLPESARPTLERFRELAQDGLEAKAIVRELKAGGGDL